MCLLFDHTYTCLVYVYINIYAYYSVCVVGVKYIHVCVCVYICIHAYYSVYLVGVVAIEHDTNKLILKTVHARFC